MKKKTKIINIIVCFVLMIVTCFIFTGCSQADTTRHNIQKKADEFNVYRKMTFVNLYTGELLYSAEGYFQSKRLMIILIKVNKK